VTPHAPSFERHEFSCPCGCGFDTVDAALLHLLQRIRDHFDRPVHITSGCRCPAYNATLPDASEDSQHLRGKAADIVVDGIPAHLVQELAQQWSVPGLGQYDDFTHVDVRRGMARW